MLSHGLVAADKRTVAVTGRNMEVRAIQFTTLHRRHPIFISAFSALALALIPLACDAPPQPPALVNWETPHVHPIDLTPNTALLLAVNTPDNRLELFAATDDGLSPLGAIPVSLDPVTVRARSNTEAWVVNHISDSISVVDLESRQVVATLHVGDEPCDVVFAGSPMRAFVTLSQENRVRVYNPDDLSAEPTTLDIEGEDPRALAVAPDGSRIYAAIFESGNATTLVPHYDVSNPDGPYGGQNPPPNAGADFAPAIAPSAINPPPVGQIVRKIDGHWIDINGADWSAKVFWDLHDHDVAIIDANTLDITYAAGLMNIDMNLAVHPSGSVTVIGSEAINEIRFEPNLRGTFARMVMATFDPLVPDSAVIRDLNPHLDYTKASIPNNQRKRSISDPRSIVWNAAGSRAYIAGMGSDNVIVIDEFGDRIAELSVPAGPTGLALDESRNRLLVLSKFDASVTIIDTSNNAVNETLSFFDPTLKPSSAAVRICTTRPNHLRSARCPAPPAMSMPAWIRSRGTSATRPARRRNSTSPAASAPFSFPARIGIP
ncbi:MAG: hypothetical protein IPK83_01820 [Planctomycetes bacterium]|nr:hypothetical protein [Planctomycetota bacterium]